MAPILHPNLTSHLVETLLQLATSDGLQRCHIYKICILTKWKDVNTLRTGDADLRFYITTVQDG